MFNTYPRCCWLWVLKMFLLDSFILILVFVDSTKPDVFFSIEIHSCEIHCLGKQGRELFSAWTASTSRSYELICLRPPTLLQLFLKATRQRYWTGAFTGTKYRLSIIIRMLWKKFVKINEVLCLASSNLKVHF